MATEHDTLDAVIGRYLELAEAGRAPEVSAYVAEHPAHREALLSFLADHQAMCAAVGGGRSSDGPSGGATGAFRSLGWSVVPGPPAGPGEDAGSVTDDLAASTAATPSRDVGPTAGDRYAIVGEIARGGMGAVLRAVDVRFGRPVALKVLREDRDDEILRRRFLFEAHVTGSLQHPGIPPVHDQGRLPDGRLYLAMKLIEGRTLGDLLDERASPADALPVYLNVFGQVCQTLAYAHSRRIIHRDLKPLNVMVGAFGEVQVMDWGMARRLPETPKPVVPVENPPASSTVSALGGAASETVLYHTLVPDPYATVAPPSANTDVPDTTPQDERLTRGGDVMGTLSYMPPEQARGQIDLLDERSDVFGLGAILCHLLTGHAPYLRRDDAPLLAQAQLGTVDDAFRRLDACGADAELIALAKRCLAPKREDRPADAGAVALAVSEHLAAVQRRLETAKVETAAATARSEVEARRRRLAQLMTKVIVLAVLAAALAGSWYWQDRSTKRTELAARRRHVESQASRTLEEARTELLRLDDRLIDPVEYRKLTNDPGAWKRTLDASTARVQEAKSVVATGGVDVDPEIHKEANLLTEAIDGSEKQRVFAAELELIRFSMMSGVGAQGSGRVTSFRDTETADRSDRTLKMFGFDVARPEVVGKIRQSSLRLGLIDAIDFWAVADPDPDRVVRLLEVVRTLDPEPWRDRVRDPAYRADAGQLAGLAAVDSLPGQPPGIVQVLALLMKQAGGDPAPLLQRAISASPRDFGLHAMLGALSTDRRESIGACRAALAIRPDAAPMHKQLGHLLVMEGHTEAGIAEVRESLRLNVEKAKRENRRATNMHVVLNNLGFTLLNAGKPAEAEVELREALRLRPGDTNAHNNLGLALERQGRLDEAEAEFRAALEAEPGHANENLARVVRQRRGSAIVASPGTAPNESSPAEAEIPTRAPD